MEYNQQVPAYLRDPALNVDTDKFTGGIGSSRGPHISFANGRWIALDSAGNETNITQFHQQLGAYADVVVIDANPGKARVYYETEFVQGSNEAPTCFSNDGQYPDEQSTTPQAPSCAQCQWSRWGSEISKNSGKEIKACSERKKLAVLSLHSFAGPVFEFSVSPSNLKTWNAYIRDTIGRGFPPHLLVTRVSFGQTQGSLVFTNAADPSGTGVWFVPQHLLETVKGAMASEETKQAIGFYARPAGGALIAHQPATQIAHQPGESAQPAAQPAGTLNGQPSGQTQASQPAGAATGASENAGTQAAPRKRRTREQIDADNAAAANAQQPAAQPVAVATPPAQAGFGFGGGTAPAAQPAAQSPAFGFGGATAAAPNGGGQPHSFGVANPVPTGNDLDAAINAALAN